MPRRNRVDPWGDLHAVSARGLFTGNRGCIVDKHEQVVRHHRSSTLWITCLTEFRDWRVPLARPSRWTPIFFLDDAVALAAGHRPCATCRRDMYRSYRDAVDPALRAVELDRRLTTERLRRASATRARRPHARIFFQRLDATRSADRDRRRGGAHAADIGEGARQRLHAGAAPNSWLMRLRTVSEDRVRCLCFAKTPLGDQVVDVWSAPIGRPR